MRMTVQIGERDRDHGILQQFERRVLAGNLETRTQERRGRAPGDDAFGRQERRQFERRFLDRVGEGDRGGEAAVRDHGRLLPAGLHVRRERHRDLAVLVGREHRLAQTQARALHRLAGRVDRGEDVPRRAAALGHAQASLAHERAARDARSRTFDHVEAGLLQLGQLERLGVTDHLRHGRIVKHASERRHGRVEVDVGLHLAAEDAAGGERVDHVDGQAQALHVLDVERERHVGVGREDLRVRLRPVQLHAVLQRLELRGGKRLRVGVRRGPPREEVRLGADARERLLLDHVAERGEVVSRAAERGEVLGDEGVGRDEGIRTLPVAFREAEVEVHGELRARVNPVAVRAAELEVGLVLRAPQTGERGQERVDERDPLFRELHGGGIVVGIVVRTGHELSEDDPRVRLGTAKVARGSLQRLGEAGEGVQREPLEAVEVAALVGQEICPQGLERPRHVEEVAVRQGRWRPFGVRARLLADDGQEGEVLVQLRLERVPGVLPERDERNQVLIEAGRVGVRGERHLACARRDGDAAAAFQRAQQAGPRSRVVEQVAAPFAKRQPREKIVECRAVIRPPHALPAVQERVRVLEAPLRLGVEYGVGEPRFRIGAQGGDQRRAVGGKGVGFREADVGLVGKVKCAERERQHRH